MQVLAFPSLPVPVHPSRDLLALNCVGPADPFYSFPSHFSPDSFVLLAPYLSLLQDPLFLSWRLCLSLSVIGRHSFGANMSLTIQCPDTDPAIKRLAFPFDSTDFLRNLLELQKIKLLHLRQ